MSDSGLGRSLADIRRELEGSTTARGAHVVAGILEGAEERGAECAELTAGEAWGLLLTMPADKRLRWLDNVLEQAHAGHVCWEQDHRCKLEAAARRHTDLAGRVAELEEHALPRLVVPAELTESNPPDTYSALAYGRKAGHELPAAAPQPPADAEDGGR